MQYPDYNDDQKIDLKDAIIALKTVAGFFDNSSRSVFSFTVMDTSGNNQSNVPVTVVYTFDKGQVQPDTTLIASLEQRKRSDPTTIAQMNPLETYDDGSVSQAEITVMLPELPENVEQTIQILSSNQPTTAPDIRLSDVLQTDFDTTIQLTQNNHQFHLNLRELLQSGVVETRVSGPIFSDFHVKGVLSGLENLSQNVMADITIRMFKGFERCRVYIVLENLLGQIQGVQNFIYDLKIQTGDAIYHRKMVSFYPGMKTSKYMWWGPPVYVHISDNRIDETLITSLHLETDASDNQTAYPVTIGHVFKKGAVPSGFSLKGKYNNTSEIEVPMQVDIKAIHDDGSLRHGVLSFFVPASTESQTYDIQLFRYRNFSISKDQPVMLSDLMNSTFSSRVTVAVNEIQYAVSLKDALSDNTPDQWLKGSIASEWLVSSPLMSSDGSTHPHLNARFSIRAYKGLETIRVSACLENNWTYQENPQNLLYDADIYVNDQWIYGRDHLKHFHHARWRKVFFWQRSQDAPIIQFEEPVHVKHNIRYLIGTKAIPNFNPDLINSIPENKIQEMRNKWEDTTIFSDPDGNSYSLANNQPMGIGVVYAGTQSFDMWPLPYWAGRYLLSMDRRAKDITLGTADLAGSFPMHFRDRQTGLPVSINDYPYCSTYSKPSVSDNPNTGQNEAPLKCNESNTDCWAPFDVNTAKMPEFCYVPYLVTGDAYYLDELHFWANNTILSMTPHYRQYNRGVFTGEVIFQAMSLGILGRTVFITPNDHPLKSYFAQILENNKDHLLEQHIETTQNEYGGLSHSSKLSSRGNDYYTFSLNSLVEMGFDDFKPILQWNALYPVSRMDTGNDFCWIFAAIDLKCSDTDSGQMYQRMDEVYQKNIEAGKIDDGGLSCGSQALADYLKENGKISSGIAGEMIGYNDCAYCNIANMQPALAAAVDARIDGAEDAWARFMARPIKPNYISKAYPNFDIVPRKMAFAKTDLPKGSIGSQYSFQFEVNSGEEPYYWELIDNGLPQEFLLEPSGYLFGIPSQAGDYTFSILVTDAIQTTIQKTLVLKIIDPEQVPFLSLSRMNITFPDQLIGQKSYAAHIGITNTGREPLLIDSITASSVFPINHTCPPQLQQNETCRISAFFKPSEEQKYTGSISIMSNAENGDQVIALTGNGVTIPPEKDLGIWVKSINFGAQPLTFQSMDSSIQIANNSQLPIEIQDIRIDGSGFSMNNQCGEVISPKSQCSVDIAILPETSGPIAANLVIESNADNAPHIIPLKGIGSDSILDVPICELTLENLSNNQLVNQPVTVGHSFVQGDIPAGKTVKMNIDSTNIPVQVEHKSVHADGSLKHALLSFILPEISSRSTKQVQLYASQQITDQQPLKLADLLATNYDAKLTIELDGTTYMASARQLLESTPNKQWISGPICTEWLVNSPLKDSNGNLHPHLTARFEIRAYVGMEDIRSSITLENNWTYEPDPQNFSYHASIQIGDETAWDQPEQIHFHHARWRKVFWWSKQNGLNQSSNIHVKHDVKYLIASKAIPNFDPQFINGVSEYYLNEMETRWTKTKVYAPYYCDRAYTMTVSDPMAIGFSAHYMPTTGGRGDIGPITRWTSRYLMSMDARAKKVELGHGNLSGSWSMHFRDKNTDHPVSIEDYPYCSTIWNVSNSYNPNTKMNERPTECQEGTDCQTPYSHDTSHHPSFAYVPYLVSGDYYYLEELQFWANYCVISLNPHYRDFQKGLLKGNGQTRGQAWSLRTLAEVAYALPDDHPMKAYFMRQMDNNLDWYNEKYTTNENANQLGWIFPLIGFNDGAVISPWMDDFFTFAVGHAAELGFEKAEPFLTWKSIFPVGRMIDETFCWIFASGYRTVVAASKEDADAGIYYQTFAEIFGPSLAWRESNTRDIYEEILALECNSPEMTELLNQHKMLQNGYNGEMMSYTSDVEHGYQVILETALAYAVDSGISGAREAWDRIQNRAKKPDFNKKASYKWSIIPRKSESTESEPEKYTKFVSIQNNKFHLEGEEWYPYGVNYWPHYSVHFPGVSETTKPSSEYWLGSANYQPAVIEEDLTVMESLGMNCISILGSLEPDTWDAMIDVLNRCQQHNIKVFLSFPYANPLKPEFYNIDSETALDNVITTLKLDEHPAIFAYDIAWEPYLCLRQYRQRYDEKWSRFIQKEFGSIENAQNVFGRNIDIQQLGRSAGILSHNIPTRAIAGQSYVCHLKMKNTGTETWTADLKYALGRIIGDDSFPGRVVVPREVPSGDEVDLVFTYNAPANSGRYRISFCMLQEWVEWFGPKVDWEIEVIASGLSVQKNILYPPPILGPTDEELVKTEPDNLVNAFRRFGDTHTAIRFGQTIRKIKTQDPNHLISCRQGYGGNGNDWAIRFYPLELHATAHHFDFLGPEAYDFMINIDSDNILSGMATIEAYCRWASNGKPVVWTEAAYFSKLNPDETHLQEQSIFYDTFISHMLTTHSDGILFWYWPGGSRVDEQSDYGITDIDKNLRPAAFTMQDRAREATSMRPIPEAEVIGEVNLFTSNGGFVGIYDQHRSAALAAYKSGKRYVMRGDGYGTTSAQEPEMIAGMPKHLWAEMGQIELKAGDGEWFEVRDGMAYAVPANTPIQARAVVVNMGDSKWLTTKDGTHGAVYFAGNQNVGLFFKAPISNEVNRMEEAIVHPFMMTNGLTEDTTIQFQMLANAVAWMNGTIRVLLFPVSE